MDWGFEDVDLNEPPQPARLERELVPEGEHVFQIQRINETTESVIVVLRHTEPRYGWVWVTLPRTADWAKRIMASLAQALGFTPEQWREAEIGDVVQRWVRAQVYHKPGRDGRVFVNARVFLPVMAADVPSAPAQEKPAAKRSQAAKAHQATTEGNADAIPF